MPSCLTPVYFLKYQGALESYQNLVLCKDVPGNLPEINFQFGQCLLALGKVVKPAQIDLLNVQYSHTPSSDVDIAYIGRNNFPLCTAIVHKTKHFDDSALTILLLQPWQPIEAASKFQAEIQACGEKGHSRAALGLVAALCAQAEDGVNKDDLILRADALLLGVLESLQGQSSVQLY